MITPRMKARRQLRKAYFDGGGHEELWDWLRVAEGDDSGEGSAQETAPAPGKEDKPERSLARKVLRRHRA